MKINIIGAGMSGLYAGYLLSKSGIDCELFEASHRSGGRVYSHIVNDHRFVELGAELVYAPQGPLMKSLDKLSDPVCTFNGESYYFYQDQLVSGNNLKLFSGLREFLQEIDELEDYDDQEISLLDYFQTQNYYTPEMANLLEAFACEYGTTAEKLGLKNLALEESRWSGGDDEFYTLSPMQRISDYYQNKIKGNIRYNTIIKKIIYAANQVIIIDDQDHEYISDKVIVSVSLGVLKAGDISFSPALPTDKQQAIQRIGIDAGIKVILIFTEQWWPDDLSTVEGGNACFEFLATKKYKLPTLTCFIMGRMTQGLHSLSSKQLGELLTGDLDNMFGHGKASKTLSEVYFKDWGEDIFHKGAYSFPTEHSHGMRDVLAKPVDEKLYFMGEACNVNGHAASVHGAMETAERVCLQISQ